MVNLFLKEGLKVILAHELPLREGLSPNGSAPCYLVELALLAPGLHGRGALKIDRLRHFRNKC